ncbi:hypothetical protein [Anaerosporobacter sp.]|uniref:hypothetical protein n=1 Tax=Anaerosporobacter sp. TaxID=1872529 RepID=UPI00286F5F69|nr:hypothetical protein [Anaerosporobacter sp.]
MLKEQDMSYEKLKEYIIGTTCAGIEMLSDKERKEREACIEQAMTDLNQLLPDGIDTMNNKIKEYVDENGEIAGALWTTVVSEDDYLRLALILVREEH